MDPVPFATRRNFLKAAAVGCAPSSPAYGAEREHVIDKATRAVKVAIPRAEADPERPAYHFHPPAQWNNDPNGTIQYKGWYHIFYQFNPYEAKWGHMHWGHARSRDLVNWEHLPIALWPSLEKGEEHVFSGAAIIGEGGRPVIFYTSIGKRDPEQWMAVPEDDELIRWKKHPANPVLTTKLHTTYKVHEWRDPFLFRHAGGVYMVAGGNLDPRGGYGEVQLYEARNRELTEWRHRGAIFRDPDRTVWNIECPNFFPLGGKWVLLTSPHRSCEYFVGDFDLAANRFTPTAQGVLDPGAAYASNVLIDDRGRRILFLWSNTQTPASKGWCGAMVMPRVLTIGTDGHLKQEPVPAFEQLRAGEESMNDTPLDNREMRLKVTGDALEIQARFETEGAKAVELKLRGAKIVFTPGDGWVTVGKERIFAGRDRNLDLRVFLDKRMMEVYANGTAAVHLTEPAPAAASVFARDGAASIRSLKTWRMRSAEMNIERFQPTWSTP